MTDLGEVGKLLLGRDTLSLWGQLRHVLQEREVLVNSSDFDQGNGDGDKIEFCTNSSSPLSEESDQL